MKDIIQDAIFNNFKGGVALMTKIRDSKPNKQEIAHNILTRPDCLDELSKTVKDELKAEMLKPKNVERVSKAIFGAQEISHEKGCWRVENFDAAAKAAIKAMWGEE